MIIFYGAGSPNPHKVSIALEELGLPYEARSVNTHAGEQFTAAFRALNPNAKVPVILDEDTGQVIWESNAILLYLAEKTGKLFPRAGAERNEATQLLFFQAASIGPMFGQRAHFSLFAPQKLPYAIARYSDEGNRLHAVLDTLLEGRDHFLEGGYSMVDIAVFGWAWCAHHMGFTFQDHPNLARWFERVAARPAVAKGVTVPAALPDFSGFLGKT